MDLGRQLIIVQINNKSQEVKNAISLPREEEIKQIENDSSILNKMKGGIGNAYDNVKNKMEEIHLKEKAISAGIYIADKAKFVASKVYDKAIEIKVN